MFELGLFWGLILLVILGVAASSKMKVQKEDAELCLSEWTIKEVD